MQILPNWSHMYREGQDYWQILSVIELWESFYQPEEALAGAATFAGGQLIIKIKSHSIIVVTTHGLEDAMQHEFIQHSLENHYKNLLTEDTLCLYSYFLHNARIQECHCVLYGITPMLKSWMKSAINSAWMQDRVVLITWRHFPWVGGRMNELIFFFLRMPMA